MTKDEAIKVLKMVEAHGLAEVAKVIAIEALETEAIPVEWINKYANEHRAYIHAFAEMVVCWNERKEE